MEPRTPKRTTNSAPARRPAQKRLTNSSMTTSLIWASPGDHDIELMCRLVHGILLARFSAACDGPPGLRWQGEGPVRHLALDFASAGGGRRHLCKEVAQAFR